MPRCSEDRGKNQKPAAAVVLESAAIFATESLGLRAGEPPLSGVEEARGLGLPAPSNCPPRAVEGPTAEADAGLERSGASKVAPEGSGDSWDAAFGSFEQCHVDLPQTIRFLLSTLAALDAQGLRPQAVLIEDAANGPAGQQTLKRKVPGLLPIPARGSKESRAHAVPSRQQQKGMKARRESSGVGSFQHAGDGLEGGSA